MSKISLHNRLQLRRIVREAIRDFRLREAYRDATPAEVEKYWKKAPSYIKNHDFVKVAGLTDAKQEYADYKVQGLSDSRIDDEWNEESVDDEE